MWTWLLTTLILLLGSSPHGGNSKCLLSFDVFTLSNQDRTHRQQRWCLLLLPLTHLHSTIGWWQCVLDPGLQGARATGFLTILPRTELPTPCSFWVHRAHNGIRIWTYKTDQWKETLRVVGRRLSAMQSCRAGSWALAGKGMEGRCRCDRSTPPSCCNPDRYSPRNTKGRGFLTGCTGTAEGRVGPRAF